MAKKALTDRTLKALKPAATGKRFEILDSVVPGLAVRVTERGHKTFALIARYPGSLNPTRRALGTYGAMGLADAREKARTWLELIAQGIDPKAEESRQKLDEERRHAGTFGAIAEVFIARHVYGNGDARRALRTADEVESAIRRELLGQTKRKTPEGSTHWVSDPGEPCWRDRPIGDITRHDVIEALDRVMRRGGPYGAHHLLAHTRKLFNWAIGRGVYGLNRSPCDRIKPNEAIGKRPERTRILTDDELRHVWRAANAAAYPFGPLVHLLLLTGQRRSEIAEARWPEIDLDKALLIVQADRMKGDRAHVVPLAPEAVAILRELPRWKGGGYIFTMTSGRRPVSGFAKMKERLDRLVLERMRAEARRRGDNPETVELVHWRLHDLRRTVRTNFSAIPAQDLVRELAIAHAKPGLHKVYDQWAYLDEKRDLLERWAKRLVAIVEPAAETVVALERWRR